MSDTATAAPTGSDNGSVSTAATITGSAVTGGIPDGATTQPSSAPAAPAPAVPWLEGADDLTVGYTQNKGWKAPTDVVQSYQNLEKLLGADRAGRTVVLPGENATPEEQAAFYNKLGRPSDAADYKLPVPEGYGDPNFAKEASSKFHELGLSVKQARELTEWYNGKAGGAMQQTETQKVESFKADQESLLRDWGQAHDQNVIIARNTANKLGLDAPTIDKLADALGHKGTMELLHKIGAKSGEAEFVSGDTTNSFGNALTPAQAKDQIRSLMNDKDFASRYLNKDVEAIAKMKSLHAYAYPE